MELPPLRKNEVLVRMDAAAINPADLYLSRGNYGTKKPLPTVPGFEGSGVVVKTGGGLLAWRLLGRRVMCSSIDNLPGTWAEYTVTNANQCIALNNDKVSNELGACSFTNPLTVLAFLDIVQKEKHKAVIITAACSAIGKMINRLFNANNIKVINIVRRDDQVKLMKELGFNYIVD